MPCNILQAMIGRNESPIDQRYTEQDMQRIVRIINNSNSMAEFTLRQTCRMIYSRFFICCKDKMSNFHIFVA